MELFFALIYAAGFLLSWGVFIAICPKEPAANLVAALLWPAAWLLAIGYALGDR